MSSGDTFSTAFTSAVTPRRGSSCWADLISTHIGDDHKTEAVGSEEGFSGRLTSWRYGDLSFVFSAVRGASVRGIQPESGILSSAQDIWLCLCLSGSFELVIRRTSTVIDPSRIAVTVCGQPHTVTFAPDCDVLWVRAPRRHFRELGRSVGHLVLDASSGIAQIALRSLTAMFNEADRLDGRDSYLVVNSTLGLASAAVKQTLRARLQPEQADQRMHLDELKRFIDGNLGDESFCLQSAARLLGKSPRQLNKLFESQGTSFMKWTWGRRLERAHYMVIEGNHEDASITDIALACGFKNLSHFSRVFHARYGYAPSALRLRSRCTEKH